jgi:RNA polymerase sigma-70 factor, ECF subfamily
MAVRESQNVSLDAEGDAGAAWQVPVRAPQQTHVELLEVLRQLAKLPPEQREVLVLAAVDEMRYEEIATMLSIPVGTVMSRLSRAREKLRRAMSETPGESTPLKIVR